MRMLIPNRNILWSAQIMKIFLCSGIIDNQMIFKS